MRKAKKPKRKRFCVVPERAGLLGWRVKGPGLIPDLWCTKAAAVDHARHVARARQPSQLVIHKRDGTFQEERTYPRSSDPFPPRG